MEKTEGDTGKSRVWASPKLEIPRKQPNPQGKRAFYLSRPSNSSRSQLTSTSLSKTAGNTCEFPENIKHGIHYSVQGPQQCKAISRKSMWKRRKRGGLRINKSRKARCALGTLLREGTTILRNHSSRRYLKVLQNLLLLLEPGTSQAPHGKNPRKKI